MNIITSQSTRPMPSLTSILGVEERDVHIRSIKPADIEDADAAAVIASAAADIRDIYSRSIIAASSFESREDYYYACGATAEVALETVDALADERDASIAAAVFKRAGFYSSQLRPTRLQAQVEIEMLALDSVRKIRFLLARQQALLH